MNLTPSMIIDVLLNLSCESRDWCQSTHSCCEVTDKQHLELMTKFSQRNRGEMKDFIV